MQEFCEFRVHEENAHLLFNPDEGKNLGGVIKIDLLTSDPRFPLMGLLNEKLWNESRASLFTGWYLYRKYTKLEIEQAEAFHLMITSVFEPVGEACGTEYDESTTCLKCGAGRTQKSPLRLDLRRVPKSRDLARSIAGEMIVSQRVAELAIDQKLTGVGFHPVLHKARYQDDPVDMLQTKAGWKLRQQAEHAGLKLNSWEFFVWLNREEQQKEWEKVVEEYSERKSNKEKTSCKPLPMRYQLVVTSKPVNIVPPTKGGDHPFDEDKEGRFKCPYGHTIGLNLLSELHLMKSDYDGSDFFITKQMTGVINRQGVLVPEPMLLISPKARKVFESAKIKGWKTDVAYFH